MKNLTELGKKVTEIGKKNYGIRILVHFLTQIHKHCFSIIAL
jgi:hypothetical protein